MLEVRVPPRGGVQGAVRILKLTVVTGKLQGGTAARLGAGLRGRGGRLGCGDTLKRGVESDVEVASHDNGAFGRDACEEGGEGGGKELGLRSVVVSGAKAGGIGRDERKLMPPPRHVDGDEAATGRA